MLMRPIKDNFLMKITTQEKADPFHPKNMKYLDKLFVEFR
jgi:hypothetical protein